MTITMSVLRPLRMRLTRKVRNRLTMIFHKNISLYQLSYIKINHTGNILSHLIISLACLRDNTSDTDFKAAAVTLGDWRISNKI